MVIPEEYIIQKFYQHAGYPKFVRSTNTYMGGCPVCREGNSWNRKRRCYYIPKNSVICCHNCGWYGAPVKWVMEIEKINFSELAKQIETGDYEYGVHINEQPVRVNTDDLPKDSINLFDKSQLSYYASDPVVRQACSTIVSRRLNTAANKPKSLYVTLTDYVHKNRLVIPFYDKDGKCSFYQTRKLLNTVDNPKYLSKQNSEKTLFNYNNIEPNADQLYITEGPIDSFFIKNSVAVAGIQERSQQLFFATQQKQIERLFLMQPTWVLDSQWQDSASRMKSEILLNQGACVFLWPRDLGKQFKDINDVCVKFKIDQLGSEFIQKNTYCGLQGIVKLKQIR